MAKTKKGATVDVIRYRLPLDTKICQEALQKEKDKPVELGKARAVSGWTMRKPITESLDAHVEYRRLHSAPKAYVWSSPNTMLPSVSASGG